MKTPRTDLEEANQTQRFGGYIVKSDFARQLERELIEANARIAQLERGEFICHKCGMRKDSEKVEADF